jgi:hypothetical protein
LATLEEEFTTKDTKKVIGVAGCGLKKFENLKMRKFENAKLEENLKM